MPRLCFFASVMALVIVALATPMPGQPGSWTANPEKPQWDTPKPTHDWHGDDDTQTDTPPTCSRTKRQLIANGVNVNYDCGNNVVFFPADNTLALAEGYNLQLGGGAVEGSNGALYPNRFNLIPPGAFPTIEAKCGNSGTLFEYPIFFSPDTFLSLGPRANPGLDRVVFNLCGDLCGIVTHRGQQGNNFAECVPIG
jgi:hypothetical protein